MTKLISLLLILVMAGICSSDDTISVCDALHRRGSLNHKLVTIRGIQAATEEGAWLKAPDCEEPIMVGGRSWPSLIWLEMSMQLRKGGGVESADLAASVKRMNTEISKRGFDPKRDRLWLTYVGVLEANDEGERLGAKGPVGDLSGFGHLNAAPVRLIVKDVRDPVVEPAKSPEAPPKARH